MSEKTVRYRPFEDGDFDEIVPIMQGLWHTKRDDEAFSRLEAIDDLAHMLSKANFSQIALVDDVVCGIVLARAGEIDPAWLTRWRDVQDRARQEMRALSAERFADYMAFVEGEGATNRSLLAASGLADGGEVVLLALSPAARGHGVGRALVESARAHLAGAGALPGYLYTDTSCTWQFYEHLGLTRAAEHIATPEEQGIIEPEMYLYRLDA